MRPSRTVPGVRTEFCVLKISNRCCDPSGSSIPKSLDPRIRVDLGADLLESGHALRTPRIRTLLVATAGVATGYAAVPNLFAYQNAGRLGPIPGLSAAEYHATAAAFAAGTHVTILGLLFLLPRMTARRWMIVIAIAATLLAVKVHLSRVADEYRAIAEHHDSLGLALSSGRQWSGSLDEETHIFINGSDDEEELRGRDLATVLWHMRLAKKYRSAALCPWLPVPPDSPEPD
jgi:hypothetical protein